MRNNFYIQKALIIAVIMICSINSFAQFSGAFAPANWNFSTTTIGGDGSVNTAGAPASIVLSGSDNNSGGCCSLYEQYSITIPASGMISFDYSHVNPDLDDAYYVINGVTTLITNVGSGTISNIAVNAGDVFGFRVFNQDNCCGRGVLTISNFVFIPEGSALNFNGSNDKVDISNSINSILDPLNTITVEAWVYPTNTVFNGVIVGNYASPSNSMQFLLRRDSDFYTFWVDDGSGYKVVSSGASSVVLNTWQHIAGVWDGSALYIYINGVLISTTTGVTGSSFASTSNNIVIGCNSFPEPFAGSIDEVRIWSIPRTKCDINLYKNCEIPSSATGLLANYHFNQGIDGGNNSTITSLTDASGNTNTGTLNNFALTGTTSNWISPSAIVNDFATPLTLPTSIVTTTNVSCNGGSNGSIAATTTGGTPSYTYLWSNGAITSSITTLTPGVYTRTVTDANSCTSISTTTVTQPSALVTSTAVTNISCNGGANGVAGITASGGTAGYTYLWSNGATTSAATGLLAGVYTATVTDANNCKSIKNATITQPSALVTSTAVTNIACNGGSNGVAAITASGGTAGYTYLWSNGATTSAATGLLAGVYTATVTDANSCKSIKNATVTQPSALTTTSAVTNVLCNGGSGSATVTATGGTGAYTYLASNGATVSTQSGLMAGTYNYTVTDANACTKTQVLTITQPSALTTTSAVTNVLCNGGSGSATVTATGGTGAYTYLASNGATVSTQSGLMAGTYNYTVTDANACTKTQVLTITQPSALTTTSAVTNVLCNGGSGSATVTATGGTGAYTYLASNGATVSTQSGLMAGTYNYTVTDANACTKTQILTITEPNAINLSASVSNATICAGASSTLTANATGGTGTLTYTWVSGPTTNVNTVTPAATAVYTVDVTDANNCAATSTVEVTVNALPTIMVNSGSICAGQSFTMVPTGAVTYTYSNGTDVVMPTADATYSVSGTDANGCASNVDAVSSVTVNVLPTISVNSGSICAGQSFTMVPTGALTYTYTSGTDVVMPTADATYSVSGTDANGCVSNVDAVSSVTVNALPTITVNSGAICAGQSFTMVPTGALTYTYTSGTDVVMPTADATYSVSGTDANGCVSNVDAVSSVTVNTLPTISAVTNNTLLCVGQTATLSVTGALTYTWSTTENTTDIAVTPTVQTTYTVDGTDVNGCANTTMITQNVNDCTGIETLSNDVSIKVYPNPNNGLFVMELISTSKVTVTNALGQVVIAETFEAGKHTVDIHNEATGVYFVKVLENNKQQMIRLIKQ